ncbi:vesicle-trafficking protein SEC22b-like [Halichondria panicea]|uniref:vesicle-trafficking protein SEC22b-like n=1 Tax=Halichondria panicea TaxID=6063 RepID=UPI00312BBB61
MAHLTLIARASDGLPLSTSIVNEESGRDYAEYQPKAKQIFRKLSSVSPPRCSIECDPGRMVFHYILEEGICYLPLCDPTYPAKLAFNYLENLHKDFSKQHGNDVHKASRPYHFIEFGGSPTSTCGGWCGTTLYSSTIPATVYCTHDYRYWALQSRPSLGTLCHPNATISLKLIWKCGWFYSSFACKCLVDCLSVCL